ncbi:MAG: cytochrome b [Zetaproteobacteria bacterium CG2_30_46_52]|nr:MAG: cytochrome b [Zetaproteobacteria bacterium CG2_30_46_52]
MSETSVQVWDIFVRVFHWSLVFFFTVTYLSGDALETVHAYAGYIIIILLGLRLIWGVVGTPYARFTNFIYSPQSIKAYLKSLLSKHPKHYLGHNPAGGAMVILLLIFVALTSWSGLKAYQAEGKGPLASTEISWVNVAQADNDSRDKGKKGDEFWEDVHELLANFTLFLIFVHIAGVFVSSVLHKENLVRAMISGKKKPLE